MRWAARRVGVGRPKESNTRAGRDGLAHFTGYYHRRQTHRLAGIVAVQRRGKELIIIPWAYCYIPTYPLPSVNPHDHLEGVSAAQRPVVQLSGVPRPLDARRVDLASIVMADNVEECRRGYGGSSNCATAESYDIMLKKSEPCPPLISNYVYVHNYN